MRRNYLAWVGSMLLGGLLACSHHSIPAVPDQPPPPKPPQTAALWVGTARADLTRPPGGATFGHGPDARVIDGLWERTYCRVFYFETESGQKLALIPCELPAMSGLLQRQVAARTTDVLHASQLMMTAVHTHAGTGHFFGARQYTGIFSSRLPGYDDALMLYLADRISEALHRAVESKRRAKLGWEHANDFWCFTRNRSLGAYRLNRAPFIATSPPPPCAEGRPERSAIDPAMHVLRIDGYDPKAPDKLIGPIGSISFYAMHPTVVRNTNQLLGGDIAGVVSRYVEAQLRRQPCRPSKPGHDGCSNDPLHGIVNTNEGDVSPIWSTGDIDEALHIGQAVGSFVWQRHPQKPGATTTVLDSRYLEEDITKARFSEGSTEYHLCKYGQLGQGAARGGADHPTAVAPLKMFSGESVVDSSGTGCHAPKVPLLGIISRMTRESGSFPTVLPLAVANIGDTLIAFAPAELTVTAGQQVRANIARQLVGIAGAPSQLVVAGLANEYIQYVATYDEYQAQDYEGASTLFGPNTARYFANRFGLLAKSIFAKDPNEPLPGQHLDFSPREMSFGFGPSIETGVEGVGDSFERKALGFCRMPAPAREEVPRFCFYWRDGGPGAVGIKRERWIRVLDDAARPHPIRLCLPNSSGVCDRLALVDDRGLEFRTRAHAEIADGWLWSTLFAPSPETWVELQHRKAKLRVGQIPLVESPLFEKGLLPPTCTLPQARLCTVGAQTEDWSTLVPK